MSVRILINAYWGSATSLDLTDLTNFNVLSWDGLGMAPVKNILRTGPMQQGSTRVGSKLQPRIISLVVDAVATTIPTFFSQRSALLQAFVAMSAYPLKLIVEWDIAGPAVLKRLIDVFYNGQFNMSSKDMAGLHQKTIVELIAPYPVWRDDTLVTMTLSGEAACESGSTPHTYLGSWEVQPHSIKITGPITDPIITVVHPDGTSEALDFTGATIAAGHYYNIDCRYDYRTIMLDDVTDKSGDLVSATSDFGTFSIRKVIDSGTHLVVGLNTVHSDGSGADANTKVEVKFYANYIGI